MWQKENPLSATCHKICEIYNINKNMCATKYKLGLLIAICDVISCIYTWYL
jgi:hypothetical protein